MLCLETSSKQSPSELIADLHLIKLFIHHTLRFERALQHGGALPKIAAACIDASFDEMRKEGYADDGLFSSMGEFFLPLTISEEELRHTADNTRIKEQQGRLEVINDTIPSLESQLNDAMQRQSESRDEIKILTEKQNIANQSYRNTQRQLVTDSTVETSE